MSTTNILDLNNRIDELEKNSGGGGSSDSAKRLDIATEFNTTTSYTAGCFVYHDGKLYQFNADHSAGAWDPTDVVEANVTDQIVSNASAIAGLTASDVAYDNTDSGLTATDVQGALDELDQSYPAEKVMMSDGVTSVEDALDEVVANANKNNLGAFVDLEPYNTNQNLFSVPTDGYVSIGAGQNASTRGRIYGSLSSDNYMNLTEIGVSGVDSYHTVFVKKGMRILFISKTGTTAACFFRYFPIS